MKGLKDTLSQLAGFRRRFDRLVSLAAADPSIVITAALKAAGLVKSDDPDSRADTKTLDPRGIIASTLRSVGLLKE